MISEKKFLELIKKEYKNKLLEALGEADVLDDRGNILITKDLKVRHKDSGYEYTVDDVIKQGDSIKIVLRSPESPRFEPPGQEELLGEPPTQNLLGEFWGDFMSKAITQVKSDAKANPGALVVYWEGDDNSEEDELSEEDEISEQNEQRHSSLPVEHIPDQASDEEEVIFVIDKKDFEEDYEVK